MPEKSVREMNRLERQHYSLAARAFRLTILGAVIFGLISLLVGFGLFSYSLIKRSIKSADSLSRNTATILEKVVDVRPFAEEVKKTYFSLTDKQREEADADDYGKAFAGFEKKEIYQTAQSVFVDFKQSSDVYDVYLAFFDEKAGNVIYLIDGEVESEDAGFPGEFEKAQEKELKTFNDQNRDEILWEIDRSEKYGWIATSGVPLKNESGETVAYVLTDVSLTGVIGSMRNFLIQYAVIMFLIVNLVAVLIALKMKKMIAVPVNAIAAAAEKYVSDRKEGIKNTDHFSSLSISNGDEIENLALIMADMEKDLSNYEEDLEKVTAEKERVGTELALATRIQADMLPNIFPAFPERREFDIYASMNPAKEVGGDFYDFFLVDEKHLGLVMADVSGKGVPAALFMMISKILVQNYAMLGYSPKKVLETVNAQICSNNREEMFVTVWLGVLDLDTGKLIAANAGHEYPALKGQDGSFELIRDKHGFVIGGMDGARYKEYELRLRPGSKLFLYTDGVPEATDANGELFGTDRMLEALRLAENQTPEAVLRSVRQAVDAFVGESEQFDDLTMLCLSFAGNGKVEEDEMTFEAKVENVTPATDFVNEALEKAQCPMKAQMQIDVALDELFSNVARYAYAPGTGDVVVNVMTGKNFAEITLIDSGKPYNPLEKEDPDVTLSAKDRPIGGLGIYLVKKTMNEVRYRYENKQNIVTIKKEW